MKTHEQKLHELKLFGFLDALQAQAASTDYATLCFEDRLSLLIEAEWLSRTGKKLARNLHAAKLKLPGASIEHFDADAKRGLPKRQLLELATCNWVASHQNIVITGPTGVGKTFLACALASQACRRGHRTLYRRVSRLFDELALARADGTYSRVLMRLAKVDVLVLDDWGLMPTTDMQRRDLNEIMDDRYDTHSTIVTSQLPIEMWHDSLADPTSADAICDRILGKSHRLVLTGPSLRQEKLTQNQPS